MRKWMIRLALTVFLFIIWSIAAKLIHNPILLPAPETVLQTMYFQVQSFQFWQAAAHTALWSALALIFSFAAGLILALLSFFIRSLEEGIRPAVSAIQAIPNAAYIILFLFWMNRQLVVFLVTCFLVAPVFYNSFAEQLHTTEKRWKPVWTIYPQPWWYQLKMVYWPNLKTAMLGALLSGVSMSFKATVMGEVLASIPIGIGKSMQTARLNLNIEQVLAWMLWIVILVFIIQKLCTCVEKKCSRIRKAE